MSDDHAKFTQQVRALVAENDRVPEQREPVDAVEHLIADAYRAGFNDGYERAGEIAVRTARGTSVGGK